MEKNIVKEKAFAFSLEVISVYKTLTKERHEYVMSKQLLRSGTAIGASIYEAEEAESKADFIHKLSISLKETNECGYWLELLYQSDYLEKEIYYSLKDAQGQLFRLLTSIIKKTKENLKN